MNWPYVAGLFDGEGSVSLIQQPGGWIRAAVCIATNSKDLRSQIKAFLERHGIATTESSNRNPNGKSVRITACKWRECKVFVEKLLLEGGVIEKRPQLELFMQGVRIWEARNALPRREYLIRLDHIRRRLHGFAKKGPKTLKRWNFPRQRTTARWTPDNALGTEKV
jgi:hypothetical protein